MDEQNEEPLKDEAEKRREWRGPEEKPAGDSHEQDDSAKPSGGAHGQFAPPD